MRLQVKFIELQKSLLANSNRENANAEEQVLNASLVRHDDCETSLVEASANIG
jgi:hypothetical protein